MGRIHTCSNINKSNKSVIRTYVVRLRKSKHVRPSDARPRPGAAKTPKIGKSETKHARERSERACLVADFPIFGVLDAVRAWGGGRLGHKWTRNFSLI